MASAQMTDAELLEAVKLVAKHGNVYAAAKAAGIPDPTFRRRYERALARGFTPNTTVLSDADRLRLENQRLRRDVLNLTREHDSAERIRQEIFGLAARTPEPPAWLTPARPKVGRRGVPMMIWSDWHFGEVVRPEEVGGVNEFNAEIAAMRNNRLVNTTIDLCFNHMGRADTVYPGAVVCLGGDMITGDIHEELQDTNDRTTIQQVHDLTDLLGSAVDTMAGAFGRIFLPCVVGNHGRSTRKPRMKGVVFTSYEWLLYNQLERLFRNDKRVRFLIPGETDAYFKVYGHRFLLTHGDRLGVKGGDGIIGAIGPIMRGTVKLGNSEAQIGREFDTLLMGHWHQELWLPGCIVNGALKGFDEYARLALRAPYSRPSQALWFVHPEHGLTAHWPVYLDQRRETTDSMVWTQWQEQAP